MNWKHLTHDTSCRLKVRCCSCRVFFVLRDYEIKLENTNSSPKSPSCLFGDTLLVTPKGLWSYILHPPLTADML